MKLTLNILGVLCACGIGWLGGSLVRDGNWQIGIAIFLLFLYSWSKYGLLLLLEKKIKKIKERENEQ